MHIARKGDQAALLGGAVERRGDSDAGGGPGGRKHRAEYAMLPPQRLPLFMVRFRWTFPGALPGTAAQKKEK